MHTTSSQPDLPSGVYLPSHIRWTDSITPNGIWYTKQKPHGRDVDPEKVYYRVTLIANQWTYEDRGKSYHGQVVTNSTFTSDGRHKEIPYNLETPQYSYFNGTAGNWRHKRFIGTVTRTETTEQEPLIGFRNNHWVFLDRPNTRVPTISGPIERTASDITRELLASIEAEEQGGPFRPEQQPQQSRSPSPGREKPERPEQRKPEGSKPPSPSGSPHDSDNEDDSMSNNNETRISAPEIFEGDRTKTEQFLMDCDLYFGINEVKYDTDKKKIIFALSYMKNGTAGAWKLVFAKDHASGYGTWNEFKTSFRESFEPIDQEANTRLELDQLRQGNGNADDYVSKFKILISRSGIADEGSQIMMFMKGLNPVLRNKIYGSYPLPTKMEDWYKRSTTMDNQWRFANSLGQGFASSSNWRNRQNRPSSDTRVRALTFQERKQHMQEGRCFKCHEIGHRANDPKFHPRPPGQSTPPSRQQPPPYRQQSIRQTTTQATTSRQTPHQTENLPQGLGAIRELIRQVKDMSVEDQELVLEMFDEPGEGTEEDPKEDF